MNARFQSLVKAAGGRLAARRPTLYLAAGTCGLAAESDLAPPEGTVEAGCDGACFQSPSLYMRPGAGWRRAGGVDGRELEASVAAARPVEEVQAEPFWAGQHRRLLRRCGRCDPESLEEALAEGVYAAFALAMEGPPEAVIERAERAGLRGRGGAYFSAGAKWRSAREAPGEAALVVNAEEGEPGVFKDRHLMEGDPHRLIEGMLIAAYACGAREAFIYVNGTAVLSARRLEGALARAREAGLLGRRILGSDFSLEVEVYRGAGGYVCGEESVILESIEGQRAMPRPRPPYPTRHGLFGRPTVINNVETLASVPDLLLDPGATADTKIFCLSGHLRRPSVVEVKLGTRLRDVLEGIGGGAPGARLKAALLGGPSGGLLPEKLFDVELWPGWPLHEAGALLGSGGIVAFDESVSMLEVARRLTAYNAQESCGKCTPCREGTQRLVELLARFPGADGATLAEVHDVLEAVGVASLCGLGQMAPGPVRSAMAHFPDEFGISS